MIDYRVKVIKYIKDLLKIDVFDGSMSFKQPIDKDYVTYYILNQELKTISNNRNLGYNKKNDNFDYLHNPFILVSLQLDIRGADSFENTNKLFYSFDLHENKEKLKKDGIYFNSISGITSLPQLKNTKFEEGYMFNLYFSFDTSMSNTFESAKTITIKEKYNGSK